MLCLVPFMLTIAYGECHITYKPLCGVSLCWMSLCWMSWRQICLKMLPRKKASIIWLKSVNYRCKGFITFGKMWNCWNHRDLSLHLERANMHCQGIACTRSFDNGLKSNESQKLECFKKHQIKFSLELWKTVNPSF